VNFTHKKRGDDGFIRSGPRKKLADLCKKRCRLGGRKKQKRAGGGSRVGSRGKTWRVGRRKSKSSWESEGEMGLESKKNKKRDRDKSTPAQQEVVGEARNPF